MAESGRLCLCIPQGLLVVVVVMVVVGSEGGDRLYSKLGDNEAKGKGVVNLVMSIACVRKGWYTINGKARKILWR